MTSEGGPAHRPRNRGATLAPKLRFPEFENADGWKESPLHKLARPVTERATDNDADMVLTLSGEHGLVLQREYFGKKIAGDSTDRYLRILRDDFVYNDRTTKASSFGTIKRLSRYPAGIVSPIYKCFRFQPSENAAFWEWYFESGSHDPALGRLINEGARAGRFNISVSQFLTTEAWRPTEQEQQRVADCLAATDAVVRAQAQKVKALSAHRRGLKQKLFPLKGEAVPRLRFGEFGGSGDWEETPLSALVSALNAGVSVNSGDRLANGDEIGVLKTSAVTSGVFDPLENKVVYDDEEISRVKEPVRADTIIISRMNTPKLVGASAYVEREFPNLFLPDRLWAAKPRPSTCMRFVAFVLGSDVGRSALSNLAGGSSGSMKNISKPDVLAMTIRVPSPSEQQRITDCLMSLDNLIAAETRKLEALNVHMKGLMREIFPRMGDVAA
jgi:type I restriction enzyme, S subunit